MSNKITPGGSLGFGGSECKMTIDEAYSIINERRAFLGSMRKNLLAVKEQIDIEENELRMAEVVLLDILALAHI